MKPTISSSKDYNDILYSRQLGSIYDSNSLKSIQKLKILLWNLKAVGIEVAKDLILMGVQELCIHDSELSTESDSSYNPFIFSRDDKKTRAEVSLKGLQELNKCVNVYIISNEENVLEKEFIEKFDCVILSDLYDFQKISWISDLSRNNPKRKTGVILTGSLGLFGYIFTDFGRIFEVQDPSGNTPNKGAILKITQKEEGILKIEYEAESRFSEGDQIYLYNSKNPKKPEKTHVVLDSNIRVTPENGIFFDLEVKLDNTSLDLEFGALINTVEEVIPITTMKFHSLADIYDNSSIMEGRVKSYDKTGLQAEKLFYVWMAFLEFSIRYSKLPGVNNEADSQAFYEIYQKLIANCQFKRRKIVPEVLDELKIKKIARQCLTQLAPWGSIWGALAAQEAVKIIGKYTPFQQMLVQEITDVSVEQQLPNNTTISEICGQRNGFLKVLFGETFCEKIASLK